MPLDTTGFIDSFENEPDREKLQKILEGVVALFKKRNWE